MATKTDHLKTSRLNNIYLASDKSLQNVNMVLMISIHLYIINIS